MDDRLLILLPAIFLAAAPLVFALGVRGAVKRTRHSYIIEIEKILKQTDVEDGESKPKTLTSNRSADKKSKDQTIAGEGSQENSKPTPTNQSENTETGSKAIMSLEFLKFKYAPERTDFFPEAWLIAGLLLFVLLFFAMGFSGLVLRGLLCTKLPENALCFEPYFQSHRSVSVVLLASIAGAYTYLLRAFQQAVQNFDLAPASFFGAASNFVFAVVVTQIAVFYLAQAATKAPTVTGLLAVTAFVGAYMPDDILRYFLSLSSIRQLKQERSDFGREIESIPIEVLDGIDGKVRYRLSDFHIESVQHLASANPLMLFVETPYGFYETLDWVSQAQLCASVGPDAMFKLWKLGIRTIFDLERTVCSKSPFFNEALLPAVARIILPDPASGTPWSNDAVIANVKMRIDGSDTRRLRQIVLRINDELGGALVTSLR